MTTELYFDTARLGRMCTEARQAEQDFSKLASQLGSSLYWERFLAQGFEALPNRIRRSSPALTCWSGLTGLRRRLASFVSLPETGSVLMAGQSRTLITLAAECLYQKCNRVLATDLEWPPYLAILKRTAVRSGKTLHVYPLRQQVLRANVGRQAMVDSLVSAYSRHDCDGLFLSDITNTGVSMPYELVAREIAQVQPLRFSVIDGAQAFGQRPVDLSDSPIDLYLAGTQKWFGAYHPLRVAFVPTESAPILHLFRRLLSQFQICDPLTDFCHSVTTGNWRAFGETVNLSALMTAAGALARWERSPLSLAERWENRRTNRRRVLDALSTVAHSAIDDSLSSGVALLNLRSGRPATTSSCTRLREYLGRQHIVASEPLCGFVRLAMPGVLVSPTALKRLRQAFSAIPYLPLSPRWF
jgi:selenocysteine lyase/cysteine desulfurase